MSEIDLSKLTPAQQGDLLRQYMRGLARQKRRVSPALKAACRRNWALAVLAKRKKYLDRLKAAWNAKEDDQDRHEHKENA